jgi:hypothetical protein
VDHLAGDASGMMRRHATDQLYANTLGPRAQEAFRIIADRPGLTVADLAGALGVTMARTWAIIEWLQRGRVRLDATPDPRLPVIEPTKAGAWGTRTAYRLSA